MPEERDNALVASPASGSQDAGRERRPLLRVDSLVSGYGQKQVLGGVDLVVGAGEVVAVIGHNGAGKSTLLKAIFGMIPLWAGRVFHNGDQIAKPEPRDWLNRGVAYVPQGNRVFSDLSVRENLEVAATPITGKPARMAGIDHALSQFPQLSGRLRQRAGTLSGGEKQMLALACAWVLSPRLLLLDEPSLGLAPPLVAEALSHLEAIVKGSGASVLIVEQKVREVLRIANRVCVLRTGSVSYWGSAKGLSDPEKLREAYL
ncbi:MAG: ABC transporter ATP-binding protein [Phycisphaerae bacterium]|nr:ABC transporter ATP-binding protein [Phycisphaerae bacterium]